MSNMSPMDAGLAANAMAQQNLVQQKLQMDALQKNLSGAPDKQAKLREACEGFESVFLQKMWEQMRQNVNKSGYLHSRDEETWQGMYDQEFSKKMSSAGGIGLADMLYEQLNQRLAQSSRDASSHSPQRLSSGSTPSNLRFGKVGEGAEAPGQNAGPNAGPGAGQNVGKAAAQNGAKPGASNDLYTELEENSAIPVSTASGQAAGSNAPAQGQQGQPAYANFDEALGQSTALGKVSDKAPLYGPAQDPGSAAEAVTDAGAAQPGAGSTLSPQDRKILDQALNEMRGEVAARPISQGDTAQPGAMQPGAAMEKANAGKAAEKPIDLTAYRNRLAPVSAPNQAPPSQAMGNRRTSKRQSGQAARLESLDGGQQAQTRTELAQPNAMAAGREVKLPNGLTNGLTNGLANGLANGQARPQQAGPAANNAAGPANSANAGSGPDTGANSAAGMVNQPASPAEEAALNTLLHNLSTRRAPAGQESASLNIKL